MNLHFVKHFIYHYLSATPIDVLHSPFVFKLYEQSIKRQSCIPPIFYDIENLRKELSNSPQPIQYVDYGALKKNQITTVGYIAKTHSKPARIAQIIHFLTKVLQPQNTIELGTSLGLTTAYLASALPLNAKLISIEGCKDVYTKASENLHQLQLSQKVILKNGLFDDLLKPTLNEIQKLDSLFIDGNHTYNATLKYFNEVLPYIHNNSYIIFDDIYWSKGMTSAWLEIINHAQVTASIDLFFIGIVFFRKEQQKQSFKLRIW